MGTFGWGLYIFYIGVHRNIAVPVYSTIQVFLAGVTYEEKTYSTVYRYTDL
jgi:hypothetical protein